MPTSRRVRYDDDELHVINSRVTSDKLPRYLRNRTRIDRTLIAHWLGINANLKD